MVIVATQVFIYLTELVPVAGDRVFQVGKRRLGYDASGFQFFAVRTCCSSEPKETDQRRQGKALQNQRDKNHAERKENDHPAMRERRAVPQHSGKRKRGCEGDAAAHASPPNDEDATSFRSGLILV